MRSLLAVVAFARAAKVAPPASCAPGAHACRACHSHHHRSDVFVQRATREEVMALRRFGVSTGQSEWVDVRDNHRQDEMQRFEPLRKWAEEALTPDERSLPLIYPMGGTDLHAALAFSRNAATIVDALPPGSLACFARDECARAASQAVREWWTGLTLRGFEQSETKKVREHFGDEKFGAMAPLVFALELHRMRVVGATTWTDADGVSGFTLEVAASVSSVQDGWRAHTWRCGRVDYVSQDLAVDGGWASARRALSAPGPFLILLKGLDPGGLEGLRSFLDDEAGVVVQDLTGPTSHLKEWNATAYGGFANKSKERDIVERNGGDANAVADAFRGGPASRRGVAQGLNIGGCLTFCVYSADGAAFISRRRVAAPSSRPAPKKWLVVGLHRPAVEALATSLGALDGASVVLNATDSIYAAAHQAAEPTTASLRAASLIWRPGNDHSAAVSAARWLRKENFAGYVHVVRRDPLLDFVDAAEGPEHRAPPEVVVNAAGAVVSVKFRDARPVSLDPAKAARAGRGGHPHLLQ